MEKVIQRAIERNVKFNSEKLQYRVNKVKYLGHIISKHGISCDPDRMVISHIGNPENKQDLQKLQGVLFQICQKLVNPNAKYLKKMYCFTGLQNTQNV